MQGCRSDAEIREREENMQEVNGLEKINEDGPHGSRGEVKESVNF
jgi:hypothetical protein